MQGATSSWQSIEKADTSRNRHWQWPPNLQCSLASQPTWQLASTLRAKKAFTFDPPMLGGCLGLDSAPCVRKKAKERAAHPVQKKLPSMDRAPRRGQDRESGGWKEWMWDGLEWRGECNLIDGNP